MAPPIEYNPNAIPASIPVKKLVEWFGTPCDTKAVKGAAPM